jgi:hypothetical protein
MLLIAAGSFAISLLVSPGPDPTQGEDRTPVVRRIAATAALAAQEYRVGVKDGKVIARPKSKRPSCSSPRPGALPPGCRSN